MTFDKNHPFYWGSATSSHQVEGQNTANDWWDWEANGHVVDASGLACDHYNRFREDFDHLVKLGHNSHRFSLEWSRFEPEEGQWNEEAFRHYEEVFRELHARGIEPFVTLHHFTNPQWFGKKGGWLSDETTFYFLRYVDKVVRAYGKWVKFWVTINEPMVYLYHSFFAGLWPPGLKAPGKSMKVLRHLLEAHVQAYHHIHHIYGTIFHQPVYVSIAKHIGYFTPCKPRSLGDRWAAVLRNWFFNEVFLNACVNGFLFFPGVFSEFLSARGTLDYIGVNYYTRDFVHFQSLTGENSLGAPCDKKHHEGEIKELNMMGWEVYPEGLYQALMKLSRYSLPIIITENGIATEDDTRREAFIRNHLDSVKRAKQAGAPVMGYFYWSLMDNFEWAHGFGPRFGIIGVDYKTQERKIRPSAHVLTELCRKL